MSTLVPVQETRGGLRPVPGPNRRRWAIVLAGGEGRRMVHWIASRAGEARPKQFCAFTGSRTMLQHTLDRAVQVTPPDNVLTVIGRGHDRYLDEDERDSIPGRVIQQPADRGTAAGVLLPATYAREHERDATLLILPSDHFIQPDHRFRQHAAHACRLAERFRDRFVLLGAVAAGAETDYGWILPDRRESSAIVRGPGHQVWPVAMFREKPPAAEALTLLQAGGLWNTMVVAVKARTLWSAARRLLPGTIDRFEFLHRVLRSIRAGETDPEREAEVLEDIYLDMPRADFSRDLLQAVADKTLVEAMHDVEWSDWGRPARVEQTVHHLIGDSHGGDFGPSASAGPAIA